MNRKSTSCRHILGHTSSVDIVVQTWRSQVTNTYFAISIDSNRNRNRNYRNGNYNNYRRQSFYQRNRNLINIAAGTGAGTLIGGVIGGKKGALIGAAIGAGSSAIYTYKIKPKNRRNNRR